MVEPKHTPRSRKTKAEVQKAARAIKKWPHSNQPHTIPAGPRAKKKQDWREVQTRMAREYEAVDPYQRPPTMREIIESQHPPKPVTPRLVDLYSEVLQHIGATEQEPEYMDLANTPTRLVKMLETELLSSYRSNAKAELIERFTTFPAPGKPSKTSLVTEVNIPFSSMCAHHMLPFFGVAHVGYVPKNKIAGLSKIPRAVDFFSRKLQIQERLVGEVADFLMEMLDPAAVLVYMEARHFCMEMRGVQKAGVLTRTSALRPVNMSANIKAEFYSVITMGRSV